LLPDDDVLTRAVQTIGIALADFPRRAGPIITTCIRTATDPGVADILQAYVALIVDVT
jgi:hypothetical protein